MEDDDASPDARRHIEENLRRVYQDVLDGELPDRFQELIQKLKEQDKQNDQEGEA